MFFWLTLTIIAFIFYLKFIKPLKQWEILKVPYVKPLPIFGNFAQFIFRKKCLADVVQDLYSAHNSRYVGIFLFNKLSIVIKDPELLKQVCIKSFDNFTDHRSFLPENSDPLFSKNLFSLKGQEWRQMRSTLSPAFTGSKMRSMYILITEIAEQFTNHFLKEINPNETRTFEIKSQFLRFANDVIASIAFGIKCDSLDEKDSAFYLMGRDAINFGGLRALKIFGYNIFPSLMKRLKVQILSKETGNFFRNLVIYNMEKREREKIVRMDMIHLLMEAKKGKLKHENIVDHDTGFANVEESHVGKTNLNTKFELDNEKLTAQVILFFLAGFETISNALSHTCYELALNEDIQKKLQEEINVTWEECNSKITYDKIIRMKYLDMVVSESLRKWPPFPAVDRVCTENFTIEPENLNEHPVFIEKKNVLWIPIHSIHRDAKYYPNPEKFDPERFSEERKKNINPLTYIPFGLGPRNCIGSRFALLEIKTLLCYLLKEFNLVVVDKTEIPLKITKKEVSMNAENGFWLGLKRK